LENDHYETYLASLKKFLEEIGMEPLTVLTHAEHLVGIEQQNHLVHKVRKCVGSPPFKIFFASNLCSEFQWDQTSHSDSILQILKCACETADRFIWKHLEKTGN